LSVATGTNISATIGTGLAYSEAQNIIISYNGDTTTHMNGPVVSYNSGTGAIVFNVVNVTGSGTYADWTFNLDGAQGVQGPTGATGPTGPTTYPGSGVAVSTGSAWGTSLVVASANTASALVQRDASGNFVAGGITATTLNASALTAAVSASGTTNIDLSLGNAFDVTMNANTTFTFTSAPSGTNLRTFTIVTTNAGSGYTLAFPANVKWAGAQVPTRTTATGAIDVWTFVTKDAGTTYYGSLSIQNAS
jgi:hypothetical protein